MTLDPPEHVGPSGIGHLAKLANQMILGMTIAAVAEARPLAARGGADPAHVRAALNGHRMVEPDFVMRGSKVTLLKDLGNTEDAVCRIRFSASVLAETASLFRGLADAEGEPDYSALICQIEL
ncbi:MAG: NAD-binding protein [Rhodobacteraceae bacterium]|nr:NAD-binding protein [Paracoccaceae bacterium]